MTSSLGKIMTPEQIAREIVSVQPINIDMVALMNDPLANMLMSNFVARTQGKELPFPYEEKS